jgi:starch phosphorylase
MLLGMTTPFSAWRCINPTYLVGAAVRHFIPNHQVTAVAYDNPIPGFKTRNCINLRLWAAKPSREFDLEAFNTGDYVQVGTKLNAILLYLKMIL